MLRLTSDEILSSCSQLCCRPSSYVLRGYYGGVSCSYWYTQQGWWGARYFLPVGTTCLITYDEMMHGYDWSLYHRSNALVSISMIDQFTSISCFGVLWHRHNITFCSCAAIMHGNDWLLHHRSVAFSIIHDWPITSLPCLVCYGTGITSFFICLPSWAPSLLCKQLLPSCCLYGGKFIA